MTRRDDWEERLSAFLASVQDAPFAWGTHDCALFAAGAVEALTGIDPAAAFRGVYDDRAGSAVALREHGKGTLLKTVDDWFYRKPPSFAHRGDLVWFAQSLGVCIGSTALFVGEERLIEAADVSSRLGLVAVPRHRWQKAWAV